MNYFEFSNSYLILYKTFELLIDDINNFINTSEFKEISTRKVLCGCESDYYELNKLAKDVKSLGIHSVEFEYDYLKNTILNINLRASMRYIGFCNFLFETYSDSLFNITDLKMKGLSPDCILHIVIDKDSLFNNTNGNLFLLTTNNNLVKVKYEIDLAKYKNLFKLNNEINNLDNIYFNLVEKHMIFSPSLSDGQEVENLKVILTLYKDSDFDKLFNILLTYNKKRLLLGYKHIYYRVVINVYFLDKFKEKLASFLISLESSNKSFSTFHFSFVYATDEKDEELEYLLEKFEKYFK